MALLVLGCLVAATLTCAGLNVVIERVAYRRLRSAPKLAPLISAIGVSFVLVNVGLLWKGALEAFSWYMRDMTRFARVNGSIAAVVVFLVWVYTQAVILLYGVEFTAAYARLRRGRPEDVPAAPTPRTQP